jgi:uncharacterized protein YdcH (DUF465 family)
MISELKDEEILDFLMTSEFDNDYKPEELKYLLLKWRYFYRILHSKKELIETEKNGEINKIKEEINSLNAIIGDMMSESNRKDMLIQNLKNRKLSLKERISGKIIFNKNENQ